MILLSTLSQPLLHGRVFFLFFFSGCAAWHADPSSPSSRLNLCPFNGRRNLTTGPSGNFHGHILYLIITNKVSPASHDFQVMQPLSDHHVFSLLPGTPRPSVLLSLGPPVHRFLFLHCSTPPPTLILFLPSYLVHSLPRYQSLYS